MSHACALIVATSIAPIPESVVFAAAERRMAGRHIRLSGVVELASGAESQVAADEACRVEHVVLAGAELEAGDVVARTRSLRRASAIDRSTATSAREELARLEQLAGLGLVAPVLVERARHESERLDQALRARRSTLRNHTASRSGVVAEVWVETGAVLAAGDPIASLVDVTKMEVRARFPASLAARLEVGLGAEIVVAGTDLRSVPTRITRVSHAADHATQLATVHFGFENSPGETTALRPGVRAIVELELDRREALSVASSAVHRRSGQDMVVVRDGDDVAIRVVTIAPHGNGLIEVVAGLDDGDAVAISGGELLLNSPNIHTLHPDWATTDFVVAPLGHGRALAARLPSGSLGVSGEIPGRIRIDGERMGLDATTLNDTLAALAASANARELPLHLFETRPARPFAARLWRRGEPAATTVDAFPILLKRPIDLAQTATAFDRDAFVAGFGPMVATADSAPTDPKGYLLVAAGILLLTIATGSLRATAVVTSSSLGIAYTAAEPSPAIAAAAAAPAIVAIAVLVRARDLPSLTGHVRAAADASRAALIAILPATLLTIWWASGSVLTTLASGLAVTPLCAALLSVTLRPLPAAASSLAAPIERVPALGFATLLIVASLGGRSLLPTTTSAVRLVAAGSPFVSPDQLDASVAHLADVGLAHGARTVLAATDRAGIVHIILTSDDAQRTRDALLGAAPPGLGLTLQSIASYGFSFPLDTEVPSPVASLTLQLLQGPAFVHGHLLELDDSSFAAQLPIETVDGQRLLSGELAPESPLPAHRNSRRTNIAGEPTEGRSGSAAGPTTPSPRRYALIAGLAGLGAGLGALLWPGDRRHTRTVIVRTTAATVAGAAIAAVGLPPLATGVNLALAWGISLGVATLFAQLASMRRSSRSRNLPVVPGRAFPESTVTSTRRTRPSAGGCLRVPSASRNVASGNR